MGLDMMKAFQEAHISRLHVYDCNDATYTFGLVREAYPDLLSSSLEQRRMDRVTRRLKANALETLRT
jgi:hypothetical protein